MRLASRLVHSLQKQPFLHTIAVETNQQKPLLISSIMAQSLLGSSPAYRSNFLKSSASTSTISGSKLKFSEIEQTKLGFLRSSKSSLALRLKASREGVGLVQETKENPPKLITKSDDGIDSFAEMKHRFLSFKQQIYLENLERYQSLAEAQAPKFMVISCADSRVCPSYILGFQPGEAFVVRNVANLVPPFENGPCETNAALEFSVNTLEVENILVTGHSCCGGIRALMSMEDEEKSSFIKNWVIVGKEARSNTKATTFNLSFDQQCTHCEKESINNSLMNLLTYPWVKERVAKGLLSIHGGYYNFVDCTYEKWTLDSSSEQETSGYAIKNREFWS
ncbi:beta carbonic anhydrase 5, chloroplastic-like isoform X2 [Rutidosis leptorrhynchoides]|uniref:beta carbonic anhydrase 5, chloroplastic-like isoform X2 n=1 Tax=Rutidosis leptorrhynchoides TaxID=125765 RepID=UPI003A997FE0